MNAIIKSSLTLLIVLLQAVSSYAQLAECKGKFLGNIMPSSWRDGPIVRDDFGDYWNQVTPENAGKWGVVESSRDNYNWSDLDQMYQYCQDNDIPFKQHVMVWGNQQPDWIGNLSASEQRAEVEEWFADFAQRYPNTDMVEVVNESIRDHADPIQFRDAIGGYNNGSSVPFLQNNSDQYGPYGTGWDYIIYAFAKARQYFPDAELMINDYGIINDPTAIDEHLEIVNILKERGLIDAVGVQCHHFSVDNMTAQQVTNNLDQLASAGLPIYVTELDITGDGSLQTQRDRYAEVFPAFWEHPDVKGVTIWGYVEGRTWEEGTGILNSDGTEQPAMTWLKDYMANRPDVCNNGPTVEFTAPGDSSTYAEPASITLEANASDNDGTIQQVQFYNGNTLLSTDQSAPYSYDWSNVSAGTYELRAVATDNEGNTAEDNITVIVNVPQGPYNNTPHPIPGTVPAEEFDVGGNNYAYYDDSPGSETGVNFRSGTDVDIEECTDTTGGYNIGYATSGEWLEYSVDVQATTSYDMHLRVACNEDNRTLTVQMAGDSIATDVAIPNTGGWQTWTTVTVEDIPLQAGEKIMRLTIGSEDYVNINYVSFTEANVSTPPSVNLTSPADNSTHTTADPINITATASDQDGAIDSVRFYGDGAYLGTATNATYGANWNNLVAGTHTIYARAYDDQGNSATSDTITIEVIECPDLTVMHDTLCEAGQASLSVSGGSGNYNWYTQQTGGDPVATGSSYSPSVSSSVTYYVEDAGAGSCDRRAVYVAVDSTHSSCEYDCNGDLNGDAFIDNCGNCAGGNTGVTPNPDADGDGVLDCNDECPDDPNKAEPGECGCGVADTDSDNDGVLDCNDGCPDDANKTSPGECGCGVADIDSDDDGTLDCNDRCPEDANKVEPGACGCGNTEESCEDCAGVANGDAFVDSCGVCAGGTTGVEPVTDSSECTTTSVSQVDKQSSAAVYPNPFRDRLTIALPANAEGTAVLMDLKGREVLSEEVSGTETFSVEGLSEGMYLLKVQINGKVEHYKIAKR